MDSAKDSGEMLAAINVEGSGFWLLFYFSVSEYKYTGLPFWITKLLVGYLI